MEHRTVVGHDGHHEGTGEEVIHPQLSLSTTICARFCPGALTVDLEQLPPEIPIFALSSGHHRSLRQADAGSNAGDVYKKLQK